MNVPSSSISAGLAGTQLAQVSGTDQSEKATESGNQVARDQVENNGEIQDPDQANDRDADGRQLLERKGTPADHADASDDENSTATSALDKKSLDPSGIRGQRLDLTG